MSVRININKTLVTQKVERATEKALWEVTSNIMADCNEFVKHDKGTLEGSSMIHSLPEKGVITWQTPYARRQYWEIKTAHKNFNPNATWKWCEAAKLKYKEKWTRQIQKAFNKNL